MSHVMSKKYSRLSMSGIYEAHDRPSRNEVVRGTGPIRYFDDVEMVTVSALQSMIKKGYSPLVLYIPKTFLSDSSESFQRASDPRAALHFGLLQLLLAQVADRNAVPSSASVTDSSVTLLAQVLSLSLSRSLSVRVY